MTYHLSEIHNNFNLYKENINDDLIKVGHIKVKITGLVELLKKIDAQDFHQYLIDNFKFAKANTATVTNVYEATHSEKHSVVQDFFNLMNPLKSHLINSLDESKFIKDDWANILKNEDSAFSHIYYPPHANGAKLDSHTDSSIFTILAGLNHEGLEILIDGKWEQVHTEDDEVIIISGALLQFMSKKYYKALFHKVVFNKNIPRKTIAMLIQPKLSSNIKLPGSKNEITYGQFHQKRLYVM